jgi:hypothetical protein
VRSVYTAMKAPISAKYAKADRSIHRYSIFGLDMETLELQQLTRLPGSGPPLRRKLGGLPPPQKACSFGASCEDHRMHQYVEERSIAPTIQQTGFLCPRLATLTTSQLELFQMPPH